MDRYDRPHMKSNRHDDHFARPAGVNFALETVAIEMTTSLTVEKDRMFHTADNCF